MSYTISVWDDSTTKQQIEKRFRNAASARRALEDRWRKNEETLYSVGTGSTTGQSVAFDGYTGLFPLSGIDGSTADSNTAYTFKNLRFIHAQMSANPPAVAMRPTSSDQEDHRKADAADRIARWAVRHYSLQERIDQLSLHTLAYGTGLIKALWDSGKGDILSFDEESGKVEMEGDISVTNPFVWNVYIDPDAKCWDDVKWIIERIYIDYEEACVRWPEKRDLLKKCLRSSGGAGSADPARRASGLEEHHYNSVELLEYWETGLASNGYLGRYAITTPEGDPVEPCRPSPYRFTRAGAISRIANDPNLDEQTREIRISKLPQQAGLPYHYLTDIDVPNTVWGRSFVEYTAGLQENLNRLDSNILDAIQAHGTARMVLPEASEIADESLSNSNWDIVRITGNQPPYFVNPPALMGEIPRFRADTIAGINEVSGVNEAMFGMQSREQSGASMQYATNQGNMVRRRLFNKYVLAVESLYGGLLNLIRKHWTIQRTISVIGKERALEAIDLKGSDIDGGYDIVGEYGVTLSLDPITRREEILTLQPLFEKAGVPMRKSLELMKLNELEGMFDRLELAGNRQKEIFDEMVASGRYVPPEDQMDHTNMISWALDYFMTQEFAVLSPETKMLLKQHNRDRAALAAAESAPPPAPAPTGALPAAMPPGELPPL